MLWDMPYLWDGAGYRRFMKMDSEALEIQGRAYFVFLMLELFWF